MFLGVIGLVLLSFIWQLWSLPVIDGGNVGSGLYPLSLAFIIVALVGMRAVRAVAQMAKTRADPATAPSAGGAAITGKQALLTSLVIVAALIGFWTSLIVAVALFLLAGLLSVERVGLRRAIGFTVGALVVVYLIFDLWLGMNVGLNGLI